MWVEYGNLSVQVTARAEPFGKIVLKLKINYFSEVIGLEYFLDTNILAEIQPVLEFCALKIVGQESRFSYLSRTVKNKDFVGSKIGI